MSVFLIKYNLIKSHGNRTFSTEDKSELVVAGLPDQAVRDIKRKYNIENKSEIRITNIIPVIDTIITDGKIH